MEKQIITVEPTFSERIWGGTRIRSQFNGRTEIDPVGEMWCVGALKTGDCHLREIGMSISEAYVKLPDWFKCDNPEFPIRVTIIDPIDKLSVQVHPGDEYAKKHDNSQGKPEAWFVIEAPSDGKIQFGHTAKTREELADRIHNGEWDALLTYVDAVPGEFLYVPFGSMHAVGKDVLCYEISRSADLTYRVYDYGRVDKKTGLHRDLHQSKSIDVITVPHTAQGPVRPPATLRNGIRVTEYFDEPYLFSLHRLEVETKGTYEYDRFMFMTVLSGTGIIGDHTVKAGSTVLIPDHFGEIEIVGNMDILSASYRESKASTNPNFVK